MKKFFPSSMKSNELAGVALLGMKKMLADYLAMAEAVINNAAELMGRNGECIAIEICPSGDVFLTCPTISGYRYDTLLPNEAIAALRLALDNVMAQQQRYAKKAVPIIITAPVMEEVPE